MTFWTNIDPYHMFYIIIYVTLKLTEHGKCLLLDFYHIGFIKNLNRITLNKPIKLCFYLKKKKLKKHYVLQR